MKASKTFDDDDHTTMQRIPAAAAAGDWQTGEEESGLRFKSTVNAFIGADELALFGRAVSDRRRQSNRHQRIQYDVAGRARFAPVLVPARRSAGGRDQ